MIDALRVCYEVVCPERFAPLHTLEIGERFDYDGFHIYRVEGKIYNNVFALRYHEPDEGDKTFGYLKFNTKGSEPEKNENKVWIWVENWVFYDYMALHYLPYIVEELGLLFHNITAIDLCLDLPFDISRKLRRLLKAKGITVILNGRKIKDRDTDRPEISYFTSGSLNKTDRYMTVNIKQRNALKDKTKGMTLLAYNKLAEIMNFSNKDYIKNAHDNPDRLYRLEIHMTNAEIREYWSRYGREVDEALIFDQGLLTVMFIEILNSLIRFDTSEGRVDFETLLGKYITTTPVSDYLKTTKNSFKEVYA